MRLRYARQALADLEDARAHIAQERPEAAQAVGERIREAVDGLLHFPDRGRPGRVRGTRELVVPATPFIVAYRVGSGRVTVVAVLHGARRWPSAFDG